MAETEMRAGETAALALADVDVARSIANVRRGKGGRGRIVPFGAATAAALDRYMTCENANCRPAAKPRSA
jgi:site-specific recombinase XerD